MDQEKQVASGSEGNQPGGIDALQRKPRIAFPGGGIGADRPAHRAIAEAQEMRHRFSA
jgi:hypothetical protein